MKLYMKTEKYQRFQCDTRCHKKYYNKFINVVNEKKKIIIFNLSQLCDFK